MHRQALAEKADRDVVAAETALGRHRHLVRPFPIDRAFTQLAFAIDQSTHRRFGRRPRSPRRRGEGSHRRSLRAASEGCIRVRTKREHDLQLPWRGALREEPTAVPAVELASSGGSIPMWKSVLDEAREIVWLASLVGGLSAVGIGIAVALSAV